MDNTLTDMCLKPHNKHHIYEGFLIGLSKQHTESGDSCCPAWSTCSLHALHVHMLLLVLVYLRNGKL